MNVERLFVGLTLAGLLGAWGLEQSGAGATWLLTVHLATFFVGSAFALREVVEGLREGAIEVDLLMVLAAAGAASVGAWDEGAMLLFLFSLSNVLQHYAMQRTEIAIAALLDLRPDRVTVRRGKALLLLATEEVAVDEVMVLRPGDRIPLDGRIVRGSAFVDEAALTGESRPVFKEVGSPVLAGTVNQNGSLEVRVERLASESTLARMIDLVSSARERKANSQTALEVFERRYAVFVLLSVLAFIAFAPMMTGKSFTDTFYQAMTLLTVASPCALVISVPATLLSALANAAREGVLIKGGANLENLAKVKVVALDKTGTLTVGRPAVVEVLPAPGVSVEELVAVAARAEHASEHPLARAVLRHAQELGLEIEPPESFEAITGKGVVATWDAQRAFVGSPRLLREAGLEADPRLHGSAEGSLLLVHREKWLGSLVVADPERPDVARQLEALRSAGVDRLVMLTGDRESVAQAVAQRLGIDEVHAHLLPEDKLEVLARLQREYGPAAMVGDGINDAPALAAATVGVAMGVGGTDVALESADVVLMRDDLAALGYALGLARKARTVVWQNIAFALAVIVTLVTVALVRGIPLPLGVVGHEGSTLLVVANGLRLLRRERASKGSHLLPQRAPQCPA